MLRLYLSHSDSAQILAEVLERHHVKNRKIIRGTNGKPYLESGELFFSLSHSAGLTLCAVSDQEIGADIEKITFRPRVAQKVFTQTEQSVANNPADFTKIWTQKESFVKQSGAGLDYGLKNVDTAKLQGVKSWRLGDFFVSICYNGT